MMSNLIIPSYIAWHYGKAFVDIFDIYKTALWFVLRFFSIGLLLRTLFSPWQRMSEEYKRGFDPEAFFSTLIVNTLMRVVGAAVRLVVIVFGLIIFLLVFFGGLIFFIIWALAPILILAGIFGSISIFSL